MASLVYQRARRSEELPIGDAWLDQYTGLSSPNGSVSHDLFSNDLIDGLRNVLRLATAHIPMYSCDASNLTSGPVSLPQNRPYFVVKQVVRFRQEVRTLDSRMAYLGPVWTIP